MDQTSRLSNVYLEAINQDRLTHPLSQLGPLSLPHGYSSNRSEGDQLGELEERAVDTPNLRVGTVMLLGVPIIGLTVDNSERLCLAQISNTLLRDFSYNEIHNRRVALGITCLQCSASQLEILRRTGAMPISSRRCGLITKREAERLVKSFIEDIPPPRLPDDFSFKVHHRCGWGCKGLFQPSRYNSSRAKCIKCLVCENYYSPNKFIFHYHKSEASEYRHPDAANFNSWRRHLFLTEENPPESLLHAWEDVKAMFNGGCRKRFSTGPRNSNYNLGSDPLTPPITQNSGNNGPLNIAPYFPFQTSTSTHSAFPNMLRGITSYGDFLRSLSLPYNAFGSRASDATNLPFFPPFNTSSTIGFSQPMSLPVLPQVVNRAKCTGNSSPRRGSLDACSSERIESKENSESSDEEISVETLDKDDNSSPLKGIENDDALTLGKPNPNMHTNHVDGLDNSYKEVEYQEVDTKFKASSSIPTTSDDIGIISCSIERNSKNDNLSPSSCEGRNFRMNNKDNENKAFSPESPVTQCGNGNCSKEELTCVKNNNLVKNDMENSTKPDVMSNKLFNDDSRLENFSSLSIEELKRRLIKTRQERQEAEQEREKIKNFLQLGSEKEIKMKGDFSRQMATLKADMEEQVEEERKGRILLEQKLIDATEVLSRLTNESSTQGI